MMLQNLIGPVADILDKFIEDKDQKARLSHEIATMAQRHAQEQVLAQLEVNKTEAAHRNLWVAGWRPFVGWTCGAAMAWHFILLPVTLFVTSFTGFEVPQLPAFDMDSLMTVLLGMLGLGGLRTFEKSKGLAR
jgi:Mg2+ and Co2+ transporter CorA